MKRSLKLFGLLFCLGIIASCSKKEETIAVDPVTVNPVSDFTVTPDSTDGFTFKFTSTGKDYKKIEWRFGDDTLKTDTNPTHTYLATGTYLVDMSTISSTGATSHKVVNVTLLPDDILQVTAAKTENLYEVKFAAHLKGTLKSILWTFNAVDPVTSAVTTTTSTDLTPSTSFAFGSFNNFSVTATTDKGSVVTIAKSVTTDGIAEDITPTYNYFFSNNENTDQGPNEGSLKLVDGNTQTKFGYYKAFAINPQIATLGFATAQTVKLYAIENGNDSESTRDPKEWYVEGSNDNETWDVLDHQNLTIGFADYLTSIGQNSTRYYRFFYYPIANPKPYLFYRWRIESTFANAFQIEEFRLYK